MLEGCTKIAVITGANAGVGLGIAQRLLQEERKNVTIVMACRNYTRASRTRDQLLEDFPFANIDIELVDVGNPASVMQFCKAMQSKYQYINYLFCNAGVLGALGINWFKIPWLFLTDPVGLLEKSDATIQALGEVNADGMGRIFASNLFGHYVMARELEQMLHNSHDGRVIWTSSITAEKAYFNIDDWQGVKSLSPYEASKWACDLVAVAMNDRYSAENLQITSFTTAPGVVASSIGNLPIWITKFRMLLHYSLRVLGVPSQNITGYRGAIADVFVALQPLDVLNHCFRYSSLTDRWGTSYVGIQALDDYDYADADKLVNHCERLYREWKEKPTEMNERLEALVS